MANGGHFRFEGWNVKAIFLKLKKTSIVWNSLTGNFISTKEFRIPVQFMANVFESIIIDVRYEQKEMKLGEVGGKNTWNINGMQKAFK